VILPEDLVGVALLLLLYWLVFDNHEPCRSK